VLECGIYGKNDLLAALLWVVPTELLTAVLPKFSLLLHRGGDRSDSSLPHGHEVAALTSDFGQLFREK
jgi:hypothetical protein